MLQSIAAWLANILISLTKDMCNELWPAIYCNHFIKKSRYFVEKPIVYLVNSTKCTTFASRK